MKKLLEFLGIISLNATVGTQTIACQRKDYRPNLNSFNKDFGLFDQKPSESDVFSPPNLTKLILISFWLGDKM